MLKHYNTQEKVLRIGGVDALTLVREYGTPLYVYDVDIIRKQYLALQNHLTKKISIFYSIKANPNLSICSFLHSLGAGAEISSAGELHAALRADFKPENIIYDGPAKSIEDLEFAIDSGVSIVNVESIEELRRVNRIAGSRAKKQDICVRINPTTGVSRAKMHMGGGAQKFGVDEEDAEAIIRLALDLDYVVLLGIHVSVGSQIMEHREILEQARHTIEIACRVSEKFNFPLKCINFGGGIGVPYDEDDVEVDIQKVGEGILSAVTELCEECHLGETRFILELGRYLTAESGVYLTKIIDIKESRGKRFAIVDGGINQSLLPITMNKKYPTFIVNKLNSPREHMVSIGGPLCTSIDMFSREVDVPDLEIGDIVGIFNSGAYGFSASMLYFLSHPLPAEVLVTEGKSFVSRARGKVEDLFANQTIIQV